MSKVTVITDATGNIVVIGLGHLSEQSVGLMPGSEEPKAALRARPGQQLHELDIPEDLEPIQTSWSELHSKVAPHIR
ncbi:MAG: hypothetical protein ABSF03_29380 [Streptosporangiaceae bacterium]|jgi:hypothetical protein